MKKTILLALTALATLGIVGCKKPSQSNPGEPDSKLKIEVKGLQTVEQEISFIAYYEDSPIAPQSDVVYSTTASDDQLVISGRKAQLKAIGDYEVEAKYTPEGEAEVSTKFTLNVKAKREEMTIAAAKAVSKAQPTSEADGVPAAVIVRGKVLSSYGKGGFIGDETGGLFIYNWYANDIDTGIYKEDGDDSHKYGYLHVGDEVIVNAYIYSYNGQPELSGSYSYDNKNYNDLEGKYIKLVDKDKELVSPLKAIDITSEDQLKEFTAEKTSELTGQTYNIKNAEFVSGTFNAVGSNSYLSFKLGSNKFQLNVHKKEDATSHAALKTMWDNLALKAGDKVNITTQFIIKNGTHDPSFCLYGAGNSITKVA